MRIIICPKCNHEVEAVEWEDGRCSYCDNEYAWMEDEISNINDNNNNLSVYWEHYVVDFIK